MNSSSSHKITALKNCRNFAPIPSNVQPEAGTYTLETLLELQKNTPRFVSRSNPEVVVVGNEDNEEEKPVEEVSRNEIVVVVGNGDNEEEKPVEAVSRNGTVEVVGNEDNEEENPVDVNVIQNLQPQRRESWTGYDLVDSIQVQPISPIIGGVSANARAIHQQAERAKKAI